MAIKPSSAASLERVKIVPHESEMVVPAGVSQIATPDLPSGGSPKEKEKENELVLDGRIDSLMGVSDQPRRGVNPDGQNKTKSIARDEEWIVPPARKTAKAAQSTGASSSALGVSPLSADAIDSG